MNDKARNERIQLIVGLGNPGREYENTRHNAGEALVRRLAEQGRANWQEERKFAALTAQVSLGSQPVRLVLPQTYMNRSGQSVGAMANFYKLQPSALLVVHDELDLAPGIARLKSGGGHGGHNGLRDIIATLGNQAGFLRLRLGIGHPGHASLVADYVLKKAPAIEQEKLDQAIDAALAVMPDIVSGQLDKAMLKLHSGKP